MNAADLITDAVVEAAARADYATYDAEADWDSIDDRTRDAWREGARAALEALAPLIAAKALRDAAGAWQTGGDAPSESIDAAHIDRQRAWSMATFGPGTRLNAILDHIGRELAEIAADPGDVTEWADVVILALDGAWRAGWEPQQIIDAIREKQAHNEARSWPDWRTSDPDRAIEHIHEATP